MVVAIEEVTEPGSAIYYTDGYVDPESGTTGASVITGNTTVMEDIGSLLFPSD